ncbi:hypothetical protein [Streptomyces sp. NBC_00198]|uniref:hypothetical protein n=1 Tax=Streptomyces sp. NBC_00198 TaxID=2975677 RepID=UPI0022553D7F|nr:hypothetical protein [Streptomyces sp. NBC_00198]MCX5285699.1 hypothetical protein [Streptomyces sp. NBC_00198]MCX5286199.1 hypothetical protein [Streptomyces sp. NBC_00198]
MPRTVPVIATESPGYFITAALWMAQFAAAAQFSIGSGSNGVPRFRGYQTSVQSLSDNTWTPLTLDTEAFDSDNGHSTSSNTSRYVVQVAGTYNILGHAAFTANATGNRAARINVNGTAIPGSFVKGLAATASHSSGVSTSAQAVCAVGDYIEVYGLHTAGTALNTAAGSDVACALGVFWIAG